MIREKEIMEKKSRLLYIIIKNKENRNQMEQTPRLSYIIIENKIKV